jgi:hypothetical protein
MTAPARETTADVIMRSPLSSEAFLRSDQRQNAPIAATRAAIVTGANSRRSSLAGIRLALNRQGHVFAGIGFEMFNDERDSPASEAAALLLARCALQWRMPALTRRCFCLAFTFPRPDASPQIGPPVINTRDRQRPWTVPSPQFIGRFVIGRFAPGNPDLCRLPHLA